MGSTNDRKIVLVSNISIWNELYEKKFALRSVYYHNFMRKRQVSLILRLNDLAAHGE